jgi:uncharacterized repeat protein (TIGR03803 family)
VNVKIFARILATATTFILLSLMCPAQTGTYQLLHSFTGGDDGGVPYAGLLLDSHGNLYGTTEFGGANNFGVVFRMNSSGKEAILHAFGAIPDAENPFTGSLIFDPEGNIYGTTCCGGTGGGNGGRGTIFEINTSGVESVLYSFQGTPDGEFGNGTLLRDAAGNFYGTTYQGGTDGWGTVYELNAAGTESVLYSFTGKLDGADPYAEVLVQDSAGNLYGTNYYLGAHEWGTIFKLAPDNTETTLYAFPGDPGAYLAYSGLVADGAGNLYGVTEGGGTECQPYGCGTVYRVTPAGDFSLIYSFQGTPDGASPFAGLVIDKAGNLYGTTISGGTDNMGTVFKIDPAGNETVLHNFGGRDGAQPFSPVVLDAKGNIYGTTRAGGTKDQGVVFAITQN